MPKILHELTYCMAVRWLVLVPHNEKVAGSRPFCAEVECSLYLEPCPAMNIQHLFFSYFLSYQPVKPHFTLYSSLETSLQCFMNHC